MPRLALFLFGPFHVALDGTPVTEFKTNKVQALLVYLAVEADRAHDREKLAGCGPTSRKKPSGSTCAHPCTACARRNDP